MERVIVFVVDILFTLLYSWLVTVVVSNQFDYDLSVSFVFVIIFVAQFIINSGVRAARGE